MGKPVHIEIDISPEGNVSIKGENIEYTSGRILSKIERLIMLEIRRRRRVMIVAARQQPEQEAESEAQVVSPEDQVVVSDTEGQKEESKDSGKLAVILANIGLGKSKSEVK